MNHITSTKIIWAILIVVLIGGVCYVGKLRLAKPSSSVDVSAKVGEGSSGPNFISDTDMRKWQQQENVRKVNNLYKQMLPTLPEHNLYCIPVSKYYCSLEGCKDIEASVFMLIGKSNDIGLFTARCDDKPCDIYGINLVPSGSIIDFITKEPHGTLFRMSQVDESFVEVVTLGTDSFVTNGYCYLKGDK